MARVRSSGVAPNISPEIRRDESGIFAEAGSVGGMAEEAIKKARIGVAVDAVKRDAPSLDS